MPNDWWRQHLACQTLAEWFGHHLVGLFFSVQANGSKQEGVYTGLVLYYEKNLLWITAGHVVDEIHKVLSNPEIDVQIMRWLDGCEIPGAESIPVHNRNLEMFSGLEFGIDFGVVKITGLDANNMLNNNRTQVITEEFWKTPHSKPEGYYVLGFPKEWAEHHETRFPDNQIFNSFLANLACLPVQQIGYRGDFHPNKEFWNDPDAFYGQILPFVDGVEDQPASLKGMSGGPLFSIERDPSDRIGYRLFGIQRSEDKDERLIRAEPIHKILGLINP